MNNMRNLDSEKVHNECPAHNLKNELQAIRVGVQLIEYEASNQLPHDETFQEVMNGIERMMSLIDSSYSNSTEE